MSDISVESPERPLRADARRNRALILQSAREVFAADGAEAQMDDVALRAGVGVGTLYRHFPTKEALLLELVRDKLRSFAENVAEALEQQGDPGEIFQAVLYRNAEVASRDAVMQQVLAGAGDQLWSAALAERERLGALTAELLGRAQRVNAVRGDVQASDIAMLMCGLCATMAHGGPDFDWRRHLALLLDGLATREAMVPPGR